MAVTLAGAVDDLPRPLPCGMWVLAADDALQAATALASDLMVSAPLSPADAQAALRDAGRARLVVAPEPAESPSMEQAEPPSLEAVEAARSSAEEAAGRLPDGLVCRDPAQLWAAAVLAVVAATAADDARAQLGERPVLDHAAAAEATSADQLLQQARAERRHRLASAHRSLFAANAFAVAILAARMVSDAVDWLVFLVAVLPIAAMVATLASMMVAARDARAAATQRALALRRVGVATLTGLSARQARVAAWEGRAAAADQLEADAARAAAAWTALAGSSVAPADVEQLVAAVVDAERTQGALVAIENGAAPVALCPEETAAPAGPVDAPPPDTAPIVVVDTLGDLGPAARRLVLDQLARRAEARPVVLVTSAADTRAWAAEAATEPGGAIVDLRERVLAGIQRLRDRAVNVRHAL